MTFKIDKKSIQAVKEKVNEEILSKASLETNKILSEVENQMYLQGTALDRVEFEKNIISRFKIPQEEYNNKVKNPIEKFLKILEEKKIFLNSIKEACYLLEQMPAAEQITRQMLLELDKKVKLEGRGVNKEQLLNLQANCSNIISQKSIIFDKINNLPRTQDDRAMAIRLDEFANAYSSFLELLSQMLYEPLSDIINFLVASEPNNKTFLYYKNNLDKDKITVENMISIITDIERNLNISYVSDMFENYLKKDIRNMVFHRRYKIERKLLREKNLSKPHKDLIVLNEKKIFDEFVKITTVFDCFFLNLYYQYLERFAPLMEKLRVVSQLQEEMKKAGIVNMAL